jgi:hypothetical protein
LLPSPQARESTPQEEYVEEMLEAGISPHARLYLPGRKWHSQRTLSRIAPTLLPTPTAGDAKQSGSRNLPGSKANPGVSLSDVFRTGGSTQPRGGEDTPPPSISGRASPGSPHPDQLTIGDV